MGLHTVADAAEGAVAQVLALLPAASVIQVLENLLGRCP
jgi:hypothetical protein